MNNKIDLFKEQSLLKPLPEQELLTYIAKYQNGFIGYKDVIINHSIRLVVSRVYKKYYQVNIDKNDLIMVGIIGLIKSIDSYDISKNVAFSTYATKCIENEINVFLRKELKFINNECMDSSLLYQNNEFSMYGELLVSDDNLVINYEDEETRQEIRFIVNSLNYPDGEIIKLYYGFYDGVTFNKTEISKMLGISRDKVSMTLYRTLRKLSSMLSCLEMSASNIRERKITKR